MRLLWFWCVFFFLAVAAAQPSPYNIRNFDGSYNLPDKRINALASDRQGFTWIGTSEGLYRFDGNEAKRFKNIPASIRNAYVTALTIDKQDRLWIGTFSAGLIMLDLRDESHRIFNISTFSEDNIAHNRIKDLLLDDEDQLWIGTQISGMQKLRTDLSGFDHFLPSLTFKDQQVREIDDAVTFFYNEKEPHLIWLGTLSGILSLDKRTGTFELFSFDEESCLDKSQFNGLENIARRFVVDSARIYAGTWGGGFCTMRRSDHKWSIHKFSEDKPATRIHNSVFVFEFPFDKKSLIVIDYDGSTYLYNKSSGSFNALTEHPIKLASPAGNRLWMATRFSKMMVLDQSPRALKSKTLPFSVTSFYHDTSRQRYIFNFNKDDGYYETTYDGTILSRSVLPEKWRGTHTLFTRQMKPFRNGVINLASPGIVYFDTISKSVVPSKILFNDRLPSFASMSFTLDSSDNLWVAGKSEGIIKASLKSEEVELYTTKNRGTHDDWVYILMTDSKGNVWYGTDRGFGLYHEKRDTFISYDLNKAIRDSNHYHGIVIDGIVEGHDGKMYISGEKGGLISIKRKNVDNLSLKADIDMHGNTRGIDYNLLIQDTDGILWQLGWNTLIAFDPKSKELNEYPLPDQIMNNWGFYAMADEGVAVAGRNGFHICTPNDSFEVAHDFEMVLTDVFILGDKKYSSYDLDSLREITLTANQNYFTINASLLGLTDPNYVNYEYRMKGLREDWTASVTGKTVSWTNLREGAYEFQMRANVEGQFVESEPLPIFISPPFYRTWWFRILAIGCFLLMAWAFYQYRMRQARIKARYEVEMAEMEMKTLRSQMNPHFIFNCLNSIRLAVFEQDFELAGKYITSFSKLLRTILRNVKSHYITLDKELEAMQLYMDLEKMRFRDKFDYKIDIEEGIQLAAVKIPPLIIQPFIENAIWHGIMPKEEKGLIEIKVINSPGGFTCIIKDDGVGRERAKGKAQRDKQQSFGIQITQERLEILNHAYGMKATLTIEDLYQNGQPSGTSVSVFIPDTDIK